MSTGMTVSVILNVLAIGATAAYAGMYYDLGMSQADYSRQCETDKKQAKKSCDQHAAEITTGFERKIAERDNALTVLERSVWATHDSEVLAIVEAGKFRRVHTDVPQPKGDSQSVAFGQDGSEYIVLFPAELTSLQASDAKFEQALRYLFTLGRVSCEGRQEFVRRGCIGSDAVGKRQVRMAL
ncbi:MAG: hypothetical protein WC551_03950 [Patescibacteria group bacterium]